jgi:hypothetical protein
MKESDITDAYLKIRKMDNTIPDEVLDFMKKSAIKALNTPEPEFGGNTEQWAINTNQKELEDLRYFKQRYFDFWEWYEDKYGHTELELWEEFEAFENKLPQEENGSVKFVVKWTTDELGNRVLTSE